MKNLLNTLIILALLVAVGYQFRTTLYDVFFRPAPCTEPIPYRLGTFDTKFNISKDYFLDALRDAEAIWEKSYGKDLFAYAPADSSLGVLQVNLLYDYRQEATSKLADLGIVVKNDRASYDALKEKFTTLKAEYEKEKNVFDLRIADFNRRQQVYNESVEYWNERGGAPKKEFDKIERERIYLEAESKDLKRTEAGMNEIVEEINALAVALNRLVTTLNLSVAKYNTTNVARGESFEEGVYSSDGWSRQIDIYEFSNRKKLVRVLTHELGHALGLGHVKDAGAIMYELNQGNSEVLTQADLAELEAICRAK